MAARGSDEMKGLMDHQKQIKAWLAEVHAKIATLEESYLEETTLGNVVRGWEVDGKAAPLFKMKGQEDKEKIFSYSSYQVFLDRQSNRDEAEVGDKRGGGTSHLGKSAEGPNKSKKSKKSSSHKRKHDDDFDFGDDGDY